MKKLALLFLMAALPGFLFSQTDQTAAEVNTEPCPNPKKLRGLCGMISNRMMDREIDDYLYRTRFIEASCLTGIESEEEKNEKIRETWMTMEDELVCNSTQFDVTNGNILKFAASTKSDVFIKDAIKWKVNLNRIDPSDNRTVLDYISFHIERHKGNALESMFKHYYKLLRDAGAKHRSEL